MSLPVELPPPRDWQVFEDFCWELFQVEWADPQATKYGRSGENQGGIDIVGRRDGGWHAVQCKRRGLFPERELTAAEVRAEVERAKQQRWKGDQRRRKLDSLVIATTAPPSVELSDVAADLTDTAGLRVEVYGWEELIRRLQRHEVLFRRWSRLLGGVASPRRASEILDFTLERSRHTAFYGREDVLAELERLLDPKLERGWVLVTGGPGMGKSAILSRYLDHLEAGGRAVPHHFLRRGAGTSAQPEVVVRSLAAQVEQLYPEQADPDAEPANRLAELLGRVSRDALVPRGERLVLVVDGLDEADAEGAINPLPRFLPHSVPAGVFMLCASRPTHPDLSWLEARDLVRRLDLDAPEWSESNHLTVEAFWEHEAPSFSPPLDASLLRSAIKGAEGNLLHAVKLKDWLEILPAEQRRPEVVPRGLYGFLTENWGRLQSLDEADFNLLEEGLGMLCAAREALPLDLLGSLLCWKGARPRTTFLRYARPMLLEEPAFWAGGKKAYRPYHESFRAFLIDEFGEEEVQSHHRRLAQTLAAWPSTVFGPNLQHRYALHYAIFHQVEAGERSAVEALASDLAYLEARCREEGVEGLESDLRRALLRWSADSSGVLASLERAIRTQSNALRSDPGSAATQLYLALRDQDWPEADIVSLLRLPQDRPRLRLRHPLQKRGPLLRTLDGHRDRVNSCAVMPDGRRVISASNDGTLRVWDLDQGSIGIRLQGHAGWVNACAVTPDGRVVSASSDRTLKVWDPDRGLVLSTLEGHGDWVRACAVTPDGRRMVSGSNDGTLRLWDLEQGSVVLTLEGHGDWVRACAVTPDCQRMVSGSSDGTLKVWDLEQGVLHSTLEGHAGEVNCCAVTPDGRCVVSGSNDGTLKIWDLAQGNVVATLESYGDWVLTCAVTPDGGRIVSGSTGCTVEVWDLRHGGLISRLEGHGGWVSGCAVTPDGRRVVSGSYDRTLRVWNLEPGSEVCTNNGHDGRVGACAMTPDGRHVVTASHDHTLRVWDLERGTVVATLESHGGWINACAVTPDGRRVVSGSTDGTLKVWDWEQDRLAFTLRGHVGWVNACAVTPDGRRVVSGSSDGMVKLWDLEQGTALSTLEGHGGWVNACAVTPDGRRVVSGSSDGTLKVWDLEHGGAIWTLEGHDDWVRACVVTPDGRRVLSGSDDRTVKVWDLEQGRLISTLEGHGDWVWACALTADGRRVVSGSSDRTLKVWDLEQLEVLETLYGSAEFLGVSIGQDWVVAGDAAGNVWMLSLSLG